jgi:PBP1b-binding outer membrane lipoprotein LpoB
MMKITKFFITLLMVAVFMGMTLGCQREEGPSEKIEKKADQPVEKTQEAVEDVEE